MTRAMEFTFVCYPKRELCLEYSSPAIVTKKYGLLNSRAGAGSTSARKSTLSFYKYQFHSFLPDDSEQRGTGIN